MKVVDNFDLTEHNSYRISATCRRAFFPESEADFLNIYSNSDKIHHPILLGGGYNVVLSKPQYDEDFILVGDSYAAINLLAEDTIHCEAGANTEAFSRFALNHNLTGAEVFYDIPSSIGGAVVMNAGASGEEIKDILIGVRYLDLSDMSIKIVDNQDIGFQYRNSIFQKEGGKVVLSAIFKLNKGNPDTIQHKMESVKAARWAKQPKDFPNAGSVFKRPSGFYVGAMIDELNLKGFGVGGAEISKKHGGFIINKGNATGKDILDIIHEVQTRVRERFGVDLEVEQRII